MTSTTSNESAMLMARSESSRNGGTGRISRRMVPKRPATSHRSPWRNSLLRLEGGAAMLRRHLILFRVIPVTIHAIDPGEDFRHCGVKLGGNFTTDAAMLEHEPGQRLVFHDGHLVVARDF